MSETGLTVISLFLMLMFIGLVSWNIYLNSMYNDLRSHTEEIWKRLDKLDLVDEWEKPEYLKK